MSKTATITQVKHVKELPSKNPKYPEPSQIWMLNLSTGETGEAWFGGQDAAPVVGQEVTYDYTAPERSDWAAKIAIVREKKGFAGKSSGGWSPQKEASVMIQGLLKSIIESGTSPAMWRGLLEQALTIHDEVLKTR